MTREQFMDLDDWTLINVYLRPNQNEDDPLEGYLPVGRVNKDDKPKSPIAASNPRDVFFYIWRQRGKTDAEIEELIKKW